MRKINSGSIHLFGLLVLLFAAGILSACSSQPQGLSTGDPAPAFSLSTASGGVVSLAEFKGKQPVLLFFHMAVG